MAFDPVPWLVEGGAEHSARLARTMIYYFTGGQEGILNSDSMKVQALPVPGGQLRVMPGVATIRNRALGSPHECYMLRSADETIVDIEPTGSSGARTDLVIARVENPHISGEPWQMPSSVEDGPYVFPRVIQNVPGAIRSVQELESVSYSAIALARVQIPANTGTITDAMVTDLRGICNPITGPMGPPGPPGPVGETGPPGEPADPCPINHCPGSGDDGDNNSGEACPNTQTEYFQWPSSAVWNIRIPGWANYFDAECYINGIQLRLGSLSGVFRLVMAGLVMFEQGWKFEWPNSTCRQWFVTARKDVFIPANMRGQTVTYSFQNKCDPSWFTGVILATNATQVIFKINFKQRAG